MNTQFRRFAVLLIVLTIVLSACGETPRRLEIEPTPVPDASNEVVIPRAYMPQTGRSAS